VYHFGIPKHSKKQRGCYDENINQSIKSIVALFLGVIILMSYGCESHLPVDISDDQLNQKTPTLLFELQDGERLIDQLRNLDTGPVARPYYTSKMRELLLEHGVDPYQDWKPVENRDQFKWLIGEEEWKEFIEDWERITEKGIEQTGYSTTEYNFDFGTSFTTLNQSAEPAITEFEVVSISNPPANGSITIHYEGEQVTTQYTSGQPAAAVAFAIYSNINNHSQIQLTATVPETGKVLLTEKRAGCDYNSNQVYISYTNGTHISVNGDSFYMANGHDGEGWCEPVNGSIPPPPTTIYVNWGSFINTSQTTGQVSMGSWTWASQNIYEIGVVSRSYHDGWLMAGLSENQNNSNYVVAGGSTTKNPNSPSVLWQQFGEHWWIPSSNADIIWVATSYDWTNF